MALITELDKAKIREARERERETAKAWGSKNQPRNQKPRKP